MEVCQCSHKYMHKALRASLISLFLSDDSALTGPIISILTSVLARIP